MIPSLPVLSEQRPLISTNLPPATAQVRNLINSTKAALLQRPVEAAGQLYQTVLPLLPAKSAPHLVLFLELLRDCVLAIVPPGEVRHLVWHTCVVSGARARAVCRA